MLITRSMRMARPVALLAEGVDRNTSGVSAVVDWFRSPSSRRAWIEMTAIRWVMSWKRVALLAEGVDRNTTPSGKSVDAKSRPPRGGRG